MRKKADWLFKQSAVVPYIKSDESVKIVLITSSSKNGWVIPKGTIERFLSPEESAAKEALEEAGITGNVISEIIAEYEYEKWGGICHVKVYPMEVLDIKDTWEEQSERKRIIVTILEAITLVKPILVPILEKFSNYSKLF